MRTFKPGEVFDRQYHLVKFLDGGGFADVWLARRTISTEDHQVALKIYPMLDEEGIKIIEAEYNVQRDLSHSHIITARHFGKDENGYPYLVMKYCNGGNASGKIQKCDEMTIARILRNVGSGLAHLHDNENIVHQDIKPNNILIDHRDGKDMYYVADLGLSLKVRTTIRKFTEKKGAGSNSLQTGLTPPPYRAPELWDKNNLGKDPVKATDIWALGATMYELITGDTPLGEFGGLMQKNDPIPPDLPPGSGMSDDLNILIKCCLAKDAWDRPRAHELSQWAKMFLNTGQWNIPEKYKSLFQSSSDSAETKLGGAPPFSLSPDFKTRSEAREGDFPQPVPNRGIYKWVAILLFVLTGGYYGVKALMSPAAKTEEQIVMVPEKAAVIPSPDPVKDSTSERIIEPKPSLKPEPKNEPEVKSAFVSLSNPKVERSPRSSCITIKKITRSRDQIVVTFVVCNNTSDDNAYTVYGSGDYAFYLETGGQHYQLKRISPVGSGSIRSNGRVTITATFEGVPSYINKVNIIEGQDQTRKEQDYWNFIGVSLPVI